MHERKVTPPTREEILAAVAIINKHHPLYRTVFVVRERYACTWTDERFLEYGTAIGTVMAALNALRSPVGQKMTTTTPINSCNTTGTNRAAGYPALMAVACSPTPRKEKKMSDIIPATADDLRECDDSEGFIRVHRETDDSWRHGARVTEVYRRESDGTFWRAKYNRSTDGDTNGLRDGEATIVQVWPRAVTVTQYTTTNPATDAA